MMHINLNTSDTTFGAFDAYDAVVDTYLLLQFCLLVCLVLYQRYQQHPWTYSAADFQCYLPSLSAAGYFPADEHHLSSFH